MRSLIQVRHITALAHNRLTRYATYQAPLAVVVRKVSLFILYIPTITTSEHIKEAFEPFFSLHNHLLNLFMNHIILMPTKDYNLHGLHLQNIVGLFMPNNDFSDCVA